MTPVFVGSVVRATANSVAASDKPLITFVLRLPGIRRRRVCVASDAGVVPIALRCFAQCGLRSNAADGGREQAGGVFSGVDDGLNPRGGSTPQGCKGKGGPSYLVVVGSRD